ncbi:hypothetical protein WSK_2737 [Novosphingobium sp. Rr 2-17]|nr:hypothetical protein WSK_2737 [Novosphingobium sp. Rr 2-17]
MNVIKSFSAIRSVQWKIALLAGCGLRAARPAAPSVPAKKKTAAPCRSPVKARPAMALADGTSEDWNAV